MPNFGTPYGGTQGGYGGASNYSPSTSEYALMVGGAGTLGTVAVNASGAAHDAASQGTALVNVGEGAGQIGLAAAEIAGTDGLATPIALLQGVNGALQLANGLQQFFNPGVPATPIQAGLTAGQAAQLNDIQSNVDTMAGNLSLDQIAAAVWNYVDPVTGNVMVVQFRDDHFRMTAMVQNGGFRIDETGRFNLDVDPASFGDIPYFPGFGLLAPLPTETLMAYLARTNPLWTWSMETPLLVAGQRGSGSSTVYVTCNVLPHEWEQFKWAYYTPSSGPPTRSMFGDLNQLFAEIPVRF